MGSRTEMLKEIQSTDRAAFDIPDTALTGDRGYRVGFGSSGVHHGEILQGVFVHRGRLRRGLMTMPCDLYRAYAAFTPSQLPVLTVEPAHKAKAFRAAAAALAALGRSYLGGHLEVVSDVPLSRGFGSSTSDVLAAITAVRDALGDDLDSTVAARLAVLAEAASDSLMFTGAPVLFAQREGVVIEEFTGPLPPMGVLGFGTSVHGAGIDTLELPPAAYSHTEIEEFAGLRDRLRDALGRGDTAELGRVASASTRINQRHLPMAGYAHIEPLVARTGALGLQTAHSGDIAGLLFDARDPEMEQRRDLAVALLRDLGISDSWKFTAGGPHPAEEEA